MQRRRWKVRSEYKIAIKQHGGGVNLRDFMRVCVSEGHFAKTVYIPTQYYLYTLTVIIIEYITFDDSSAIYFIHLICQSAVIIFRNSFSVLF